MPPHDSEYDRAAELLKATTDKFGISIRSMRGDRRSPEHLQAKREFCQTAVAEKIARSVIADILHKDVSTVAYHLNGRIRNRKLIALRKSKERAENTQRLALVIITGPIP